MMKKSIIVACMTLLWLLAGCGSMTSKKEISDNSNLIVIAGNHSGSLKPTYSTCESAIMGVCMAEGNVALIIVDGDPFLATGNVISIPKQQAHLSSTKMNAIYSSQTKQILSLMESSYAKTEEVDLLKALSLCAREAKSSQFSTGRTEVYIYDPGVNTVFLNMTVLDMESLSPDTVVAALEERDMIPDLSGLGTIHWVNVGDTDYEMTNATINGIKNTWAAIIRAGGAQVDFCSDPSTSEFDVELPYVSEIPYMIDPICPESNEPVEIEEIEEAPIVFTETDIGFKPGQSIFIDEDKASGTLSTVIEFLLENESKSVLIAGTTADWGTADYQNALSLDRSNTVKQYLVDAGIDEKRLNTVGLGSSSGFYKYDHNPDGSLNPTIASKNRSIVIMDINSERAEEILNGEFKRGELYE